MFALHLTLLTDRFAATRYNNRTATEWPPHPARIYSALVEALHAGSDQAGAEPDPAEAAALDALAACGAPHLLASGHVARRVMTVFVPVNDADQVGGRFDKLEVKVDAAAQKLAEARAAAAIATPSAAPKAAKAVEKAGGALTKARSALHEAVLRAAQPGSRGGTPDGAEKVLPWNRSKQPRTFPAAIPTHPMVTAWWPQVDAPPLLETLQAVAGRVVRVGHSSSFVHLRFVEDFVPITEDAREHWTPDDDGDYVLRVPSAEQRLALESAQTRHQGHLPGRVMPASIQRYRRGREVEGSAGSLRAGGRWVVYRIVQGATIPVYRGRELAEVIRRAIIAHAEEPVHPMLSGHGPTGPLQEEHLAVLPLAFVQHPHADGIIRGFALSLPAAADASAVQALLSALGRWETSPSDLREGADAPQVEIGVTPALRFLAERIVDEADAAVTLTRDRWQRASRRWATVLPIALDGECSSFSQGAAAQRRKAWKTAEKLIRRSVIFALNPVDRERIRVEDIEVSLCFDVPVVGAAVLRHVHPYQRAGHPRPRRLVHATITLPMSVRGPLVLGAGRHFGLGLCVPLRASEERT